MPSNEDDEDDVDSNEDSDEEEEDDEDSEEGSDDDDESTNEIAEAEKKAADLLLKEKNALNDIALIQNIFVQVDRTSKRIIRSLTLQEELRMLQDENKRITELLRISQRRDEPQSQAESYSDDEAQGDNESVSWSQYEELNDGQRAQLLERSLQLLSNDVNRRSHLDAPKRDQHAKERRSSSSKHTVR